MAVRCLLPFFALVLVSAAGGVVEQRGHSQFPPGGIGNAPFAPFALRGFPAPAARLGLEVKNTGTLDEPWASGLGGILGTAVCANARFIGLAVGCPVVP